MMGAPQNVERCLALHPGTYAVCSYPYRHAGRHSFESAAEYTARMLPDYAPPYGPDNVPRPGLRHNVARAYTWRAILVLGLIVGVLVAGCLGAFE